MKIALITRAYEPDLMEAHRDFHLSAGVDLVVGVDDGSAEREHGADWVIEGEPTEFWWPRGGSLKEVLASIPPRYASVQAVTRPFVPVFPVEGPFAERMVYRLSTPAALGEPWRPSRRLVRRVGASGPPLRGWYPIEVLHFPVHLAPPFTAEQLERAVADGVVRVDTRLRDALRTLAGGGTPAFPPPELSDDMELALDVALLGDADVIRTHARLDALEVRLAAVESTLPEMLKRTLRKFAGRK